MKKKKKYLPLLLLFAAILCGSAIFPIWSLPRIFERNMNKPQAVRQNTDSQSLLAKKESETLSEYDRIKLISGVWKSSYEQIDPETAGLSGVDAVSMARRAIQRFYDAGCYQYTFSSKFENWYSWDAVCYQCTDTSFHTYTAYFWDITFKRYDSQETHELILSENGTLLAIRNNVSSFYNSSVRRRQKWAYNTGQYFKQVYEKENGCYFLQNVQAKTLTTYPVIDSCFPNHSLDSLDSFGVLAVGDPSIKDYDTLSPKLNTKSGNQVSDSLQLYFVYTAHTDVNYFWFCTPYS